MPVRVRRTVASNRRGRGIRLCAAAMLAVSLAGLAGCSGDPSLLVTPTDAATQPYRDDAPDCGDDSTQVGPSADDLQAALDAAESGDTLRLEDTTYTGEFIVSVSGTAARPITLCGSAASVIDGGGLDRPAALTIDGAENWQLTGFEVSRGGTGISVEGASGIRITDVEVSETAGPGVHVFANSADVELTRLFVHDTGQTSGEAAFVVGSPVPAACAGSGCDLDVTDDVRMIGGVVEASEGAGVVIHAGAVDGEVSATSIEVIGAPSAVVVLEGSGWRIAANTLVAPDSDGILLRAPVDSTGSDNTIDANVFDLAADATAIDVRGAAVDLGNLVTCTNTTASDEPAESTVDCGAR